jgi:hypothetical protein
MDMHDLRALGPSISCACQLRPYTPVIVSVFDRLPLLADVGCAGLLFKFGSGKACQTNPTLVVLATPRFTGRQRFFE